MKDPVVMEIFEGATELSNIVGNYLLWHFSITICFCCAYRVVDTIVGGKFADEVDGLFITKVAIERDDIRVIEEAMYFDLSEQILLNI